MSGDLPTINETYKQLNDFLSKIRKEDEIDTQLQLLKQDLGNYVKKDKIYGMIKDAIAEHDKTIEAANEKRIQWGPIIERVITAVIIAGITALVIKGMA